MNPVHERGSMDPVYGEGPWTGVHILYSPVYLLTFSIQKFAKFESSQFKFLHSELIKVTYPIFLNKVKFCYFCLCLVGRTFGRISAFRYWCLA